MNDDLISRRAVLDAIGRVGMCKCSTNEIEAVSECTRAVKALPPVTAEPKTGRWKSFTHSAYHGIDDDGEPIWREVKVYHCNLCNRRTVIKENYCPNCGAKMESEEQE